MLGRLLRVMYIGEADQSVLRHADVCTINVWVKVAIHRAGRRGCALTCFYPVLQTDKKISDHQLSSVILPAIAHSAYMTMSYVWLSGKPQAA